MWQRYHPRVILEQVAGEIAHIGIHLACVNRVNHRLIINHAIAGKIQDDDIIPNQFQAFCIDNVAGGIHQRHMKGDVINLRQ